MATFQTRDGICLHYTETGQGLPVLAIPGLTRNSTDFNHVAPHLEGLRLIRIDLRGRGLSEWASPETYTVVQETSDVLDLLDHLGLEKTAVLGTSRGGLIAMYMAFAHKERLSGALLNDIGPKIEASGLRIISSHVGKNPAQKTYDEAAEARAKLWNGFRNVPMSRWRAEVEQHYRETPNGLAIRYDPRLGESFSQDFNGEVPTAWPLFDALEGLPTALLRGETSDILSRETAKEMKSRRPDLIYGEVEGRGHVPFLDEPQSLEVIDDWIEALQRTCRAS